MQIRRCTLPDFRAGERTFQLVAQVAGRTGRGEKGGRVLVQTLSPDHPAIRSASRHDFPGYAAHEMELRRQLQYPPFGAMIRIVVRGPREETTRGVAEDLVQRLQKATIEGDGTRIVGPAVAAISKLRGSYRFQIQLQAPAIQDFAGNCRPGDDEVQTGGRRGVYGGRRSLGYDVDGRVKAEGGRRKGGGFGVGLSCVLALEWGLPISLPPSAFRLIL